MEDVWAMENREFLSKINISIGEIVDITKADNDSAPEAKVFATT
jgi:hypothetical protein